MKCGLLGRKLGHSYSPAIHARLGNYEYGLFEKEPEDSEEKPVAKPKIARKVRNSGSKRDILN